MDTIFTPALCTQCGAKLLVDSTKEAAVCEFCQTPFIVQKAIQNYNINSYGTINIANAVIGGGPTATNYVKRAKQFEQEKNYEQAIEYYNKALDIDADCIEAIDGLLRAKEDRVLDNVAMLLRNSQFGRAVYVLKNELNGGLKSKRLSEELINIENNLNNTVFYSCEAYYRPKKMQLIATKGQLVVTGTRFVFQANAGNNEMSLMDIQGFSTVEDMNFGAENLGRTVPNCILVNYVDRMTKQKRQIHIKVHNAPKVASTLNAVLASVRC